MSADKRPNSNCYIQFQITEANFLKDDGDTFGKQDPYVRFQHQGKNFRTATHEDGGKAARFVEIFKLEGIDVAISQNNGLVIEAMEEDAASDDFLGHTAPIPYTEFVKTTDKSSAKFPLVNHKNKAVGDVVLVWTYHWEEPDFEPEVRDDDTHPLNKKCKLELTIVEANFLKDHDLVGKMDPFIQFQYGRESKKTSVAEDQGKTPKFDEKFTLSNIADAQGQLVLFAMEMDTVSSDLLGQANPIDWADLCNFIGPVKHKVDLFDAKHQVIGNLIFKSKFIWQDYVPPAPSERLDKKSRLRVIIKEAHFARDADMIGKQDPYIKFTYQGQDLQTDVKDDGGKSVKWDETFELPNVLSQIRDGNQIVFEAYDKDVASSDLLGMTDPLEFLELVQDEKVMEWELPLYEKHGEQNGFMKLSTQHVPVSPDPPLFKNINYNCQLEIRMKQAEFLKDDGDAMGKQDPFLAFEYEGRSFKTAVQDDAGKSATYDDVFLLENVEEQARSGKDLVMQAFDYDTMSNDILGTANAVTLASMCADLNPITHRLNIFKDFKKTGHIVFESQFVFQEPDPPPNPKLNPFCMLEILIVRASFLRDADLIGKQDPYITFMYNGKNVRTDTKDDAGKNAEWNEKFCLTQVQKQVESGKRFILQAYDHDVDADDLLGETKGISFVALVADEDEHTHQLKLYDKGDKEAGELIIKTRFNVIPPDPEPNEKLNRNCYLKLQILDMNTFKDADTFGKQDPLIKFKYDDKEWKTKVAQNAGKQATFNEEFELPNIVQEILQEETLIIEAHDDDAASTDLLGQSNPLSLIALTLDEEPHKHGLELYDMNYKHIGNVNIATQFVFCDVDPLPTRMNEDSFLEIKITHVSFLKDHDLFGKQDPYITFTQGENLHRTPTAHDAGKEATFDYQFTLNNIHEQLTPDELVTFQAFDEDVASSDLLGQTKPFPYRKFCQNEQLQEFPIDIFMKKEKAGTIVIQTKYSYEKELPPPPPPKKPAPKPKEPEPEKQEMNKTFNALWQGLAATKYDEKQAGTMGIKAAVKLKIQENQKQQIEARIKKMERDEAKAKRRIDQHLKMTSFIHEINNQKNKKWLDKTEYQRVQKQAEDENRAKFSKERVQQTTMVFKAREQAYLENKKTSQQIHEERVKIQNAIYQSKLQLIKEKQQNVKKIYEEKKKTKASYQSMIESNRSQSHQQKIMEQTQRAIQLAMVSKDLENQEQSYLKNLKTTISKEQQVKRALDSLRISADVSLQRHRQTLSSSARQGVRPPHLLTPIPAKEVMARTQQNN